MFYKLVLRTDKIDFKKLSNIYFEKKAFVEYIQ